MYEKPLFFSLVTVHTVRDGARCEHEKQNKLDSFFPPPTPDSPSAVERDFRLLSGTSNKMLHGCEMFMQTFWHRSSFLSLSPPESSAGLSSSR